MLHRACPTVRPPASRRFGFGLEGSLVGFLVASAFVTTLYYPNLWVLLAFMESLRQVALGFEAADFRP
jgi:hypothetical protein